MEEHVLRLRREHRIGPLRLTARCGIAASTAHRILTRHGQPPLAALDRATGELVHIDVKKLGRIPDGGGHKALGRAEGRPNKTGAGWAYLHTALDDHTRLAYRFDCPPGLHGNPRLDVCDYPEHACVDPLECEERPAAVEPRRSV